MVEINIEADKVMFEVQGWDKLWSLRSRLEIPLVHIKDAHLDPNPPMGWFQGLKLAGADLPDVFRAGTFYQEHGLVFWDVHNEANTIIIDLEHERYQKLIIEVANPEAAVKQINSALSKG